MSPELAVLFSTLVEDASGIVYNQHDHSLFASKITDHAVDLGFASLLDYYYRLRYDDPGGAEMRRLIEALTVHETYFFRELPPLVELVDRHLVPLCQARGRARVWSAACASGEEPFTMAMLLEERGVLDQVDLIGTDISSAVLARATSGRHSRRALRDGFPEAIAAKYLEVSPRGISVAPRIRNAVRFERVNLIDAAAVSQLGTFDAILCRNVLIYMGEQRVKSIVEQLSRSLAPDGMLAVGVAESLLRIGTSLRCEERGGSFFYRRAA